MSRREPEVTREGLFRDWDARFDRRCCYIVNSVIWAMQSRRGSLVGETGLVNIPVKGSCDRKREIFKGIAGCVNGIAKLSISRALQTYLVQFGIPGRSKQNLNSGLLNTFKSPRELSMTSVTLFPHRGIFTSG
jgi:hypothetical protein